MQTITLVAVFYIMINVLGVLRVFVRGSFILFLMSGIFLFMSHNKAVGKISRSAGATNPMLKHWSRKYVSKSWFKRQ